MKKILVLSTLLLSTISHADIIKCTFTEPFIDSEYSMSRSTLTYKDAENKVTVISGVSFQIKAAGVFDLVKSGNVLQTLTLDHQGSNGMADTIYPYSVKDNSSVMAANGGHGGCTSNHLKSQEPQD
jgi:uncharacterized membrane protein